MTGVVAGGLHGIVGAMAMSGVRNLTTSLGIVGEPPPEEIADEAARLAGNGSPHGGAVELAHWGYGAAAGAAYGLLPRALGQRRWCGPVYGLATWVLFERVIAPTLGLSSPGERPLAERAAIAFDHVLYGTIVGQVARRRDSAESVLDRAGQPAVR